MDVNEINVIDNEEARKGVIVAYHEIMTRLKAMNGKANEDQQPDGLTDSGNNRENSENGIYILKNENEENKIRDSIIELASSETVDELARNLSELRLFVSRSLDDIKTRLTTEYEKFYTLRQAISISKDELANLYDIKANVNTLSVLIMAQNERETTFEKEMNERKQAFENEKIQTDKERFREQNEYIHKRDTARKLDQEQYEMEKRKLYHDLLDKRREQEEAFETREATLAAREHDHQQLKDREARILAREQEFAQLKEKEMRYPEELRTAVTRAENNIAEQLTRKYEYEIRLAQIERESERKLDQQKIIALEQQIEQLKELFS